VGGWGFLVVYILGVEFWGGTGGGVCKGARCSGSRRSWCFSAGEFSLGASGGMGGMGGVAGYDPGGVGRGGGC